MKVKFHKRIHACFASASSKDAKLFKHIDFPFVPTVGMEIGDDEVEQVAASWDGDLDVWMRGERTFYERGLKEGIDHFYDHTPEFKQIVDAHIKEGWILR